jgi:hypothetical protein
MQAILFQEVLPPLGDLDLHPVWVRRPAMKRTPLLSIWIFCDLGAIAQEDIHDLVID